MGNIGVHVRNRTERTWLGQTPRSMRSEKCDVAWTLLNYNTKYQ